MGNGCPGIALSVDFAVVAWTKRKFVIRTNVRELPVNIAMHLFSSAMRLRSVVALILLSATLLNVLPSRAEMKSPRKEESSFSAAHCHGSIAKTEWTLADANSPTPACVGGKDVRRGVLDFDADEVQGAIVPFTLPGQFTGKLNVKIIWQAASTIGSVGWCVEIVTATDLKREGGGAHLRRTVHNCASDQVKKSAQHLNTALVINVTDTAPAANNDVLHIRVSRDANSSVVLDDMPGDARLFGVVIETQEAPRQVL